MKSAGQGWEELFRVSAPRQVDANGCRLVRTTCHRCRAISDVERQQDSPLTLAAPAIRYREASACRSDAISQGRALVRLGADPFLDCLSTACRSVCSKPNPTVG